MSNGACKHFRGFRHQDRAQIEPTFLKENKDCTKEKEIDIKEQPKHIPSVYPPPPPVRVLRPLKMHQIPSHNHLHQKKKKHK
jgi:hypothetical protein